MNPNFDDVEARDGKLFQFSNFREPIADRVGWLLEYRSPILLEYLAIIAHRGNQDGGTNRSTIYATERACRFAACIVRTCYVQGTLQGYSQSLLVSCWL
jgi:hypothetical protein